MIDTISNLVSALRAELEQYGEMLALLDRQQQHVIARAGDEVFQTVSLIKAQGAAIKLARTRRDECRGLLAQDFGRQQDLSFAELVPLLPPDYQPLVQALVEENNSLLVRVRQRARQNHLLLSRSMELMQNLINSLFPAHETRVYNVQGAMNSRRAGSRRIYEAIG